MTVTGYMSASSVGQGADNGDVVLTFVPYTAALSTYAPKNGQPTFTRQDFAWDYARYAAP
jgi:hypothetical protein